MTMTNLFTPETLASLVSNHIALEPEFLIFQPIEADKLSTSYEIYSPAGKFVLRIGPADGSSQLFFERRMLRQMPALHQHVREQTSVPVADVIAADFSRTLLDRDYVILEALPGTALCAVAELDHRQFNRAMTQLGVYLGQLHALTADSFGYVGDHRPMAPEETWWSAFLVMWRKLIDDVARAGFYDGREAEALRAALPAHAEHFTHAVQPCLLHMNVWSQNILIDTEGNITGILDLSHALWGDPEFEFAALDYCGISASAFWEGYPTTRPFGNSAQIRRRFYLLYEMQKYIPLQVWRDADREGALSHKENCFILASSILRDPLLS
jgi:fructosamine-3-kinase